MSAPLPPETLASIRRMKLAGKTTGAVAAHLCLPANTVKAAWSRLSRRSEAVEKAASAGQRPCMCCGKRFQSEGNHNRLCGYCKNKSHSPYAL